jgi:hypothetical protein
MSGSRLENAEEFDDFDSVTRAVALLHIISAHKLIEESFAV